MTQAVTPDSQKHRCVIIIFLQVLSIHYTSCGYGTISRTYLVMSTCHIAASPDPLFFCVAAELAIRERLRTDIYGQTEDISRMQRRFTNLLSIWRFLSGSDCS
jgi:hypothetical protein